MGREGFYEQCMSAGIIRKEDFRTLLSPADRQVAVNAVASLARGKPEDAATQILAGIAVLDGRHLPILIWGEDISREEKAAWHRAEATFWEDSASRFQGLMRSAGQSAGKTPGPSPSSPAPSQQGRPLPGPEASAQAHPAVDIGTLPLQPLPSPDPGTSDAY